MQGKEQDCLTVTLRTGIEVLFGSKDFGTGAALGMKARSSWPEGEARVIGIKRYEQFHPVMWGCKQAGNPWRVLTIDDPRLQSERKIWRGGRTMVNPAAPWLYPWRRPSLL